MSDDFVSQTEQDISDTEEPKIIFEEIKKDVSQK